MIKLFTHNDLDGAGAAILAKLAFNDTVSVEHHDYKTINEAVKLFIETEIKEYDQVYIVDISINKEVAELINTSYSDKVMLFDHHFTATWLNEYNWAIVNETVITYDKKGSKLTCGTELFYLHLIATRSLYSHPGQRHFVECVRLYDTWDWTRDEKTADKRLAKAINDLMHIYGLKDFITCCYRKLAENTCYNFRLDEVDRTLLDIERQRIEKEIDNKRKTMQEVTVLGHLAGVCFCENYISEIGNTLAKENPHLAFIVLINMSNSISYRGIHEDFNISTEIASVFGGGGHPLSCGSPISNEIRNKVISMLFEKQ